MPTIRLATHTDMRAITSRNLSAIDDLPRLYIPIEAVDIPLPPSVEPRPDLMRTWGVAHESDIADYARLFPGALVAPKNYGEFAERGELLYNGAEPVTEFVS